MAAPQVVLNVTCPGCGPVFQTETGQVEFKWTDNPTDTFGARIQIIEHDDRRQHIEVFCTHCGYCEPLTVEDMWDVLMEEFNADSLADMFCRVWKALNYEAEATSQ